MLHSFIVPTHYINDPEIGWQSDFLLALSHLIDTDFANEYSQEVLKFKKSGKPIYLDNGLFENNTAESWQSLIDKALRMGADLVFAPDSLDWAKATRENFETFYRESKERNVSYKFAYIIQAENRWEFLEEFFWANSDPRIDVIALPKHTTLKIYKHITWTDSIVENRIAWLYDIQRAAVENDITIKPVHLLGLGEWLWDLLVWRRMPWVNSNDSSSAFQTGLMLKTYQDRNLSIPGWMNPKPIDFNMANAIPYQRGIIKANIRTVLSITH